MEPGDKVIQMINS